MLKEIARAWRDKGIMHDVVEELAQMVADAEYVYNHAWECCVGQAVIDAVEEPVRTRDKAVNREERKIRRMLVEHLAINPGRDVAGCLAIIVMAKDAERIGDLAKDLFKLGATLKGRASELKHFSALASIQEKIGSTLPVLQRAIRESSEELAHQILETYKSVKPECKALEQELYSGAVPAREAAITALMNHTLTRINAHIGNVTSGIIFPIEDIDFVNRGLRREEES